MVKIVKIYNVSNDFDVTTNNVVTVKMPVQMINELDIIVEIINRYGEKGISRSSLIRELIEIFIDEFKKRYRDIFESYITLSKLEQATGISRKTILQNAREIAEALKLDIDLGAAHG